MQQRIVGFRVGAAGVVALIASLSGCHRGSSGGVPSSIEESTTSESTTTTQPSQVPIRRLNQTEVDFRFQLDSQHPGLMLPIPVTTTSAELVELLGGLDPALARSVVLRVGGGPIDAARRVNLDGLLQVADFADVPVMFECERDGVVLCEDRVVLDDLMVRHPAFSGLVVSGLGTSAETAFGLSAAMQLRLIALNEIAARHRSYVVWEAGGTTGANPFVEAGQVEALRDYLSRTARGVILVADRRTALQPMLTTAAAQGWWLAGFTGGWGVRLSDAIWASAGLSLRGTPVQTNVPDSARWSYPESLAGVELAMAVSGGAAIVVLDDVPRYTDHRSPLRTRVLNPVWSQLVEHKLFVSREVVRDATPVVFQSGRAFDSAFSSDEIFDGILRDQSCQPSAGACRVPEWIWRTRDFGFLPIVPPGTFDDWDPSILTGSVLTNQAERVDSIKEEFSPINHGTTWSTFINDTWLVANPSETTAESKRLTIVHGDVYCELTLPPRALALFRRSDRDYTIEVFRYESSEAELVGPDPWSQYLGQAAPTVGGTVEISVEPVSTWDVGITHNGEFLGTHAALAVTDHLTVAIGPK